MDRVFGGGSVQAADSGPLPLDPGGAGATTERTGPRDLSGNIRVLRWTAIVLPVLFLVTVDVLRQTVFSDQLGTIPGLIGANSLIALAVAFFSYTIFGLVGRLQRELGERNRELAALHAVSKAVSSSLDLDDVLCRSLDAVIAVTSTNAAEIWLAEDGESLAMRCHRGERGDSFLERTQFRIGEGFPGMVAEQESPLLVHDIGADPRFLRQEVVKAGFHTFCAVPLRYQTALVGVLTVAAFSPDALKRPYDISLLEGIGQRLAVAIANARLYQQVRELGALQERERLAKEMHDGMAQLLGYINTQTLALKKLLASERLSEARTELTRMENIARDLYADVREGILGLRMASRLEPDFLPLLREYVDHYRLLAGVETSIEAPPSVDGLRLPSNVEVQLMRIIQESLTNVRKHAKATAVRVSLERQDDALLITVSDNGQGFDPTRLPSRGWPRFGLQTMQERAQAVGATLTIDSAPGSGTRVSVRVPLPAVHREKVLL